jgi:uncharacterized protein (DUF58 family)
MKRTTSPSGVDSSDLLPPELLDQLGSLDLVARAIVRGSISGLHRSPFLGSGEDFARHRSYQQGDDVRRLDWRLFGRTDRLYVRLFEEDSNLQGFLLVDTSASMGFVGDGSISKLRYAQFVAAALAHIMIRGGDAAGLVSFAEDTRFHLPPRNRAGHLHDLLLSLEQLSSGGSGSTAEALSQAGGALRRRGRIVLLSDCLDDDDGSSLLESVGRLRARGDEVIVVRIATPLELGLPRTDRAERGNAGPARYFDPESPDVVIDAMPSADPGFAERVDRYYEGLRTGLEERGAEYVPLLTTTPLVTALSSWLTARSRRERTATS